MRNWASTINTAGGAYAQGQAEADAATKGTKAAMEKLGLGAGSVIYYDIENYTPSAACNNNPTGSYVNSFLSGWVSEIQSNGYVAAIYGNPAPATSWYSGGTGYSAVSPSPTDVWIAKQDNRATIWGLTLTDTAWPQNQRIHQFGGPHSETWGNQNFPSIDTDIEDADVVGGNGTKSYSFTYTTIDYPGAIETFLEAINNSGHIAGYYANQGSTAYHSFVYYGGTFTNIDFPNAIWTVAQGINNARSIVGEYADQQNVGHGFLWQAGTYTSLDYPGATSTVAFGINDDLQISGYYTDSLSNSHGFLYQGTTFTSFDCPGASQTRAFGINGDAQIGAADYFNGVGFIYAQGSCTSAPLDYVWRINNNDQLAGTLPGNNIFYHEGSYITIAVPGASSTNLFGLNDFTIDQTQSPPATARVALVGYYVSNIGHGFLATSQ